MSVIMLFLTLITVTAKAESRELVAGGEPFGLKLYCKGVLITKLENFMSDGKIQCPAKESGLKLNDIIIKINDKKINTNEEAEKIIKNSNGKPLSFIISRNNETKQIRIKPKKDSNGDYYAGIWIRDSCAGIGTISYYDNKKKVYGALGHGICDIDTGGLMPNGSGETLRADINSVDKSANNNIGSLNGVFTNSKIGSIFENTPIGIYGRLYNSVNKQKYKTAEKFEVIPGKATLITTVKGENPDYYSIEITSIHDMSKRTNRNFTVKITDKRLLNKTGGIVQGMSGSPIIQNNKLVGALTHVFLENPTEGYGVFIGNMTQR
jgi:stage IV sporulation protein B